ncbi:hypothetical protein KG892_05255 [Vermiphilus pyriformis]|jgi:hypothetical protein|nr:MAG: hypothetical protein KG892_05255 [Vermiphilus pyriformis]
MTFKRYLIPVMSITIFSLPINAGLLRNLGDDEGIALHHKLDINTTDNTQAALETVKATIDHAAHALENVQDIKINHAISMENSSSNAISKLLIKSTAGICSCLLGSGFTYHSFMHPEQYSPTTRLLAHAYGLVLLSCGVYISTH